MTAHTTLTMTYRTPARPAQRVRKVDPYRYLNRMGDKERSSARLAELRDRATVLFAAQRAWADLPAIERLWLSLLGETPVSHFLGMRS